MRLRGALWILLGSSSLVSGAEIRYNRDIRPLLSDNCFACHGPDANKVEAKLQLHSSGTARAPLGKAKDRHAIVPGKREESELWARITASDPDERMPPHDSHHELTPAQIELLGQWIDEGAKYEGHWSFQPLAAAKESSIDLFLCAELARSGLKPSGKADKATLLRRLTQDLTGLPPTPEEIVAFGESDDPGAYEQAVMNTPIIETNFKDETDFKGIDILRALRSFDPCMPCTTHVMVEGTDRVITREVTTCACGL
jgi:hypothetical protein